MNLSPKIAYLFLLAIFLFNVLMVTFFADYQVKEVDYGTLMTMTENGKIGQVEIHDNQIILTNKDRSKIFKTGIMNDPDLVMRRLLVTNS